MVLPNQLTVLRIILTPIFFYFFISEDTTYRQISLIIFIIAALTDWYDGWLARKFNYITTWGKFWDPLADKILTSAAFFGFVYIGWLDLWMVILIIVRDLIITSLRGFADYKGFGFSTSRYAQWKTFIQMAFLYYLLAVFVFMSIPEIYDGNEDLFIILGNSSFIFYFMLFITIITLHSGYNYIYKNRFIIKKLFSNET